MSNRRLVRVNRTNVASPHFILFGSRVDVTKRGLTCQVTRGDIPGRYNLVKE
jgi:hypothetical protein